MSPGILPNETAPPQPLDAPLAAIYARVSTADQADKGFSLPTQIAACQAMARQEGYNVPETSIFVDDYTGTSLNRPQFTKLRDLVRQRLVQAVFVHDQDRLTRKLAHQLLLSDEFEQAEVALRIVTMPDSEKTPEGQLLTNVRGIIAEYERAKILERTERGRRGRAQAGRPPGGRPPLGYITTAKGYEVQPDEAAIVQRIFRLYVENGLSQRAIAALLTAEGVPPPGERRRGGRRTLVVPVWHQAIVAEVLTSQTYIGCLHYGKKTRLPGKQNPDKHTRSQVVPPEQWIPIAVPPLIDSAMFAAAQDRRPANQQQSRRNRRHAYLLIGGRLRCGQCGCVMTGAIIQGKARYRCNRGRLRYLDVVAAHSRRSVAAAAIEPVVWQAVEHVLNNPAVITAELERRRGNARTQQGDLDGERQHYARQIAQCDKDVKRWEAAYLGEVIDLDDFKMKKAEVATRRASAEQELARLDAEQHALEQFKLETASLEAHCARVRGNSQRLTLEEKWDALKGLNIIVTWHPEWPAPKIEGSLPPELFAIMTNAA
jgi:site-specific DNA recombinase